MTKTVIHIGILISLLASCNVGDEGAESKNDIEIGEYNFQFPLDFNLIKEKGIDSYVGKISDGNIEFQFDYGYYSNSLDESISEYLSRDVWKWNALGRNNLLPEGDVSGLSDKAELIKFAIADSLNYTLFFLYEKDTIEYELKIPNEIFNTQIEIDTVDNIIYKFVQSNGYIGLYAKNLDGFNESINSYKALSITASNLNKKETGIAYEILRSCKPKQ